MLLPTRRTRVPRPLLAATLLALTLGLSACGSAGRITYNTPQEAYGKGIVSYEDGRYDRAVSYFRGVFDFGRTNEWADEAQYYLARAYYEDQQYLLAATEFTRFAELYRSDPRTEEAEYLRAMAYYHQSPSFALDQTNTEKAIDQFILFVTRHPASTRVAEANERILELRNKLARKQYEAGLLYARRDLHESAAVTFESVFDTYPDTPWADDALLGAVRAYIDYSDLSIESRRRERLGDALRNYERLIQIPDSPLLQEAQALYQDIQRRLEDLPAPMATDGQR
ncbi:MAG: outer membrane protein assembly factor BamD [Bacteroidota bacterium]